MGLRSVIVGTNTFIGGVEIIFDSRLVRDSRSFIQLNEPEYKRPAVRIRPDGGSMSDRVFDFCVAAMSVSVFVLCAALFLIVWSLA